MVGCQILRVLCEYLSPLRNVYAADEDEDEKGQGEDQEKKNPPPFTASPPKRKITGTGHVQTVIGSEYELDGGYSEGRLCGGYFRARGCSSWPVALP